MLEQMKKIVDELKATGKHIAIGFCITGAEDIHAVHLWAFTDNPEDPEQPIVVRDEELDFTIEEFVETLGEITDETFDCKVEPWIHWLWTFFRGYGIEHDVTVKELQKVLKHALEDHDWSLNTEFGVGIRMEVN